MNKHVKIKKIKCQVKLGVKVISVSLNLALNIQSPKTIISSII